MITGLDATRLTDEMVGLVDQMTRVEFHDQLDLMIDLRAVARVALAAPGDAHAGRSPELRRFRFMLAMLEVAIDELFRAQKYSSPEQLGPQLTEAVLAIFTVLRGLAPAVPRPGPRPH